MNGPWVHNPLLWPKYLGTRRALWVIYSHLYVQPYHRLQAVEIIINETTLNLLAEMRNAIYQNRLALDICLHLREEYVENLTWATAAYR
jgi:hypothetical protein